MCLHSAAIGAPMLCWDESTQTQTKENKNTNAMPLRARVRVRVCVCVRGARVVYRIIYYYYGMDGALGTSIWPKNKNTIIK